MKGIKSALQIVVAVFLIVLAFDFLHCFRPCYRHCGGYDYDGYGHHERRYYDY